ncbi:MAG TPA: DUF3887 domain-containing protein [Pyrinomonadaceae bacterium]|nr:DUF3887 domain-containing protein [Pyrinomonadaceae bacterium]
MKFRANQILALTLTLMLFSTGACSLIKGRELSESAVARFHNQFNSGQYPEIYNQTDEGFKKGSPEAEMTALLSAVRRKLGTVKNTNQVKYNINSTANGATVTLSYETEFTDGRATEQFIYHVSGNEAKLYRYDIMSSLLVIR